ncbi:MAG: methionine--tRNA ligase subunit beta [Tepidisphaerales bacterium]
MEPKNPDPSPAHPPAPPASIPTAGSAPALPPVGPTITYDDFAKLDLRVATVLECKPHPNADKLLVLQIDLGVERRQICAGLRQHISPEALVGKQIIVVANLAPRQMRGEVSQGMLLAATDPQTGKVITIAPSELTTPGSKVS